MMSMRLDFCAWCGRLANGRDADGDVACAEGEGCTVRPASVRATVMAWGKRGPGRRKGGKKRGPIVVRGEALSLKEWAERLGVTEGALALRAEAKKRDLALEIEDRLVNGNPGQCGGRKRAGGAPCE